MSERTYPIAKMSRRHFYIFVVLIILIFFVILKILDIIHRNCALKVLPDELFPNLTSLTWLDVRFKSPLEFTIGRLFTQNCNLLTQYLMGKIRTFKFFSWSFMLNFWDVQNSSSKVLQYAMSD